MERYRLTEGGKEGRPLFFKKNFHLYRNIKKSFFNLRPHAAAA